MVEIKNTTMPSINTVLNRFAQEYLVLTRNSSERDKIKGSLLALEQKISSHFKNEIDEIIRFGSFQRNTILPRIYDNQSDIDIMVVFNVELGELKPETYRTKLRNYLSSAYPRSYVQKDFPAVKLELNHIFFDVVPAVYRKRFWNGGNYYIPDRSGEWQLTVPNDINEPLSDANQEYGKNIVRNVIRLMKHWNSSHGNYQSYLLEKEIIEIDFYGCDVLSGFLHALEEIAYANPQVARRLPSIHENLKNKDANSAYRDLCFLLPGLHDMYPS